jgi:predicted RNA-binding Zn-ribbon protein involved in translation (DUF1610 family)
VDVRRRRAKMTTTLSQYTGGNSGYGTMISRCSICGEIVAEYECDENGIPTDAIFDNTDTHMCEEVVEG